MEVEQSGLGFSEALKFAHLGDLVWRDWSGISAGFKLSRHRGIVGDKAGTPLRAGLNGGPWLPGSISFTMADVMASDWRAITTEDSV